MDRAPGWLSVVAIMVLPAGRVLAQVPGISFLTANVRGLLGVATAVPVAVDTLRGAVSTGDIWLGLSWAAWGVLWLLYFLLLALQKPVSRLVACVAIGTGVLTGWLPGYLLLTGAMA